MANAPKLRNGLTTQQNNFKTVVLQQLVETGKINGTQAALQTYNTKDPDTAQSIATENLGKPVIQNAIEETAKSLGITQTTILERLSTIGTKEAKYWTGDTILRANMELAKLLGMYPGTKHARLNINMKGNIKDMSHSQVKEELKVIDSELNELLEEPNNLTTKE